jgi:hypothetical protein
MPILVTAKRHFDQDLARARALRLHAAAQPEGELRNDIMRSAWMMGVGASDAYFCDAYADLVARTLQARQRQPAIQLPDRLLNLKVPVVSVVRGAATDNWRWRMAARGLIEDQSVLSLESIRKLFNQFCRREHKLFGEQSFDTWVLHPQGRQRLFGTTAAAYRPLADNARHNARKAAQERFEERFDAIFQRRHDCIHNCDRPRVAINSQYVSSETYVERVLSDIEFLVTRCHETFLAEFPEFLRTLGFNGVTRNWVGV